MTGTCRLELLQTFHQVAVSLSVLGEVGGGGGGGGAAALHVNFDTSDTDECVVIISRPSAHRDNRRQMWKSVGLTVWPGKVHSRSCTLLSMTGGGSQAQPGVCNPL